MTTTAAASPTATSRKPMWRKIAGGLAIAFGIATLVEGGGVLFGSPAAVAEAGDVVPFVLFFNFGAGFLYILAGVATLARHTPALWLARLLAVTSVGVLIALLVHIVAGEPYEPRTLVAMSLRSAFWVAQALILPRLFADGRAATSCRHCPSAAG